ncbi:hypothetical protein LX16_3601 [Stackebrandtia albiflava]|uniref:Glycerophosphoryl diester phosphodiesterase family protein n=1 Tax=Stackebrandtia albiflava TaxID=406432 RepID=A0A562V4R6_9ACTN|nr:hypothetical protein [Stackebrandtia albiflava]TWJ12835.1 hypothetical protein LX16_3601 [Stackebrandtia albiflava]
MTGSPVIPLRPMTVGEVLDTAAALLRTRWQALLGMSFALALIEQVGMTALRLATAEDVRPRYWGELVGDGGMAWAWITIGLTSEIFIITLLSGPATRTAVAAVRGEDPASLPWSTLSGGRWGQVTAFAGIIALIGGVAAAACFFPWFAVYMVFGLSVPALVADRLVPGKAFWRSPKLLARSRWRTGYIRLVTYFAWLVIRLGITCGAMALLQYFDFTTLLFDYFLILLGFVYLLVNTAGYAMMACADAVIHIEARVRTEALDVAVARMRARGEPVDLPAPEAR